jgi:hypothetical protein
MKRRHLIQLGGLSAVGLIIPQIFEIFGDRKLRAVAAIPKHRDIVTLECMGNIPGSRWLDGRTGNGTVGLAPRKVGFTGTRWQIFEIDSGVYALKCLGHIKGPRWLDGRTGDGTVGLAPSTDKQFSGTRWQIFEISSNVLAFKCLGDIEGSRWLDGRTGNGTVGLAPNTPTPDGGFSGATWRLYSS